MVNSDYSIYQKPKSWISRLSIRARGIVTKHQSDDQASILSAPEILPSPASSVTSMIPTDDEDCSAFVTPSPSSSTSSCSSSFSVKKQDQTQQEQQHLPPSPTLTAYDHPTPEWNQRRYPPIPKITLPPLENNSYFSSDRPLPTKRRTPGRNRHSAIDCISRDNEQTRSVALEQLAHDTLTYFVDLPSITNPDLCDKNDEPKTRLVEKLKSRLTCSSSIHPSVLKLAQDVMTYMNETPPLTNECQQLKPKLEVCLLIHGKAVN